MDPVETEACAVDDVAIARMYGWQRGTIGLAQRVRRGRARARVGAIVVDWPMALRWPTCIVNSDRKLKWCPLFPEIEP